MSKWWSKTQSDVLVTQWFFWIRYRNRETDYGIMRSDWFGWSRAADTKPYSDFLKLCSAFLREMSHLQCCADVLTATARSTDDMVCLWTSSVHISGRASCLINLIWRCCWIMSLWAIDFDDNEKWSLSALSEHWMNPNRSKTACPRFCRVVCWFDWAYEMLRMRDIVSPLLLVLTYNNCWRSRIWIKLSEPA